VNAGPGICYGQSGEGPTVDLHQAAADMLAAVAQPS